MAISLVVPDGPVLDDLTVHDPLEVRLPDREVFPVATKTRSMPRVLGPHHEVTGMTSGHRPEGDHEVTVDHVLLGRPGQVAVGGAQPLARGQEGGRPSATGRGWLGGRLAVGRVRVDDGFELGERAGHDARMRAPREPCRSLSGQGWSDMVNLSIQ